MTEGWLEWTPIKFYRGTFDGNGKTISNIQADKLEQLCRRYDIEKRDWLKPFPKAADPDGTMEQLRLEIITPLIEFKKKTEKASTSLSSDHRLEYIVA